MLQLTIVNTVTDLHQVWEVKRYEIYSLKKRFCGVFASSVDNVTARLNSRTPLQHVFYLTDTQRSHALYRPNKHPSVQS